MKYYIQGNAAKADQIKAAFEKLGYRSFFGDTGCNQEDMIYFSLGESVRSIKARNLELFKTHPDYKELELPVEPKFKVGDWIACNADSFILSIKSVRDENYYFHQGASLPIKDIDEHYHLWSIADAKDGDVLATDNIICIFRKLDKDGYYIISPCVYTVKGGLEIISDENDTIGSCGFKPATKEDRDLLFAKMKEAGFTWDAKNKTLKKIPKHYDISNFHAGMPVLVRDGNCHEWRYVTFSHYRKVGTPFCAGGQYWYQCIPFNKKTKHLLGTTDMCDEQYINW